MGEGVRMVNGRTIIDGNECNGYAVSDGDIVNAINHQVAQREHVLKERIRVLERNLKYQLGVVKRLESESREDREIEEKAKSNQRNHDLELNWAIERAISRERDRVSRERYEREEALRKSQRLVKRLAKKLAAIEQPQEIQGIQMSVGKYTITELDASEIKTMGNALAEMPYKGVAQLMLKMQMQISRQEAEWAAAPTVTEPEIAAHTDEMGNPLAAVEPKRRGRKPGSRNKANGAVSAVDENPEPPANLGQ